MLYISGELVGVFRERNGQMLFASMPMSVLTAWANDCDYDSIFAPS